MNDNETLDFSEVNAHAYTRDMPFNVSFWLKNGAGIKYKPSKDCLLYSFKDNKFILPSGESVPMEGGRYHLSFTYSRAYVRNKRAMAVVAVLTMLVIWGVL